MCSAYCCSLILCLPCRSSRRPSVGTGSIQHPCTVLGCPGDGAGQPARAAYVFCQGISQLEGFQKVGSWSCHSVSKPAGVV